MSVSIDLKVLDGLDLWDTTHLQVPDRSRLHHLKPVGIGTPHVECLTSYLSRLAEAHHVAVISLLHEEISRFLRMDYKRPTSNMIIYAKSPNGFDSRAKYLVAALEHLTLRKDLLLLTMLRWSEVFPSRGLIRPLRSWCPNCYQEWRAAGRAVFDPLIWSIRAVEICSHHNRPLVNQCPSCGKTLPFLHSHYRAGYCSRCMKWMGRSYNEANSIDVLYPQGEIEWQKWVSNNVGELFALSAECPPPKKEKVAETLTALARKAPRHNIRGFADWLRIPHPCVLGWCKGQTLPRLSASLYICYRLGTTLAEFLTKDNIVDGIEIRSPAIYIAYKTIRKKPPRDVAALRRAFKEVLIGNEFPPPTMVSIARRLECEPGRLRLLFPELCRRISANYRQYRRKCSRENTESICEEVKRISLELHDEGIRTYCGENQTPNEKIPLPHPKTSY